MKEEVEVYNKMLEINKLFYSEPNDKQAPTIKYLTELGLEIEKIGHDLWVATYKSGVTRYDLFLEFYAVYLGEPEENTRLSPVLYVEGIPEHLKEQRHSYFASQGYVNYMDRSKLRIILDYLDNLYEDG